MTDDRRLGDSSRFRAKRLYLPSSIPLDLYFPFVGGAGIRWEGTDDANTNVSFVLSLELIHSNTNRRILSN
jgi:hypothetical protein